MERKLILVAFLILMTSLNAAARLATDRRRKTPPCVPGSTLITAAGAGTFTVPANCKSIRIEIWGAGGNGGMAYDDGFQSGGGSSGQAGGYAMKIRSVNPGDVINYTVGAAQVEYGNGGSTLADGMTAGGGAEAPCPPGYTCGFIVGYYDGTASGGAVNITGGASNWASGEFGGCTTSHAGAAAPAGPNGGGAGGLGGAGALAKPGKPGIAPGGAGGGGGLDCFNSVQGGGGAGANGGIRFTY